MALTTGRRIVSMGDNPFGVTLLSLPIAASQKIYAGAMVGIGATGYLNKMGAAALRCRGVAEKITAGTLPASGTVAVVGPVFDNTSGADGAFYVDVRVGCFFMKNYATDPVVVGDNICYAYDDYQVMHTARADNSIAGRVVRVVAGTEPGETNGAGVWVDFGAAVGITS
jgi:hypothetical protein